MKTKLTVITFCTLFLGHAVLANAKLGARTGTRHDSDSSKPNIILLITDDQDVVLGGLDQMPILKRLLMERGTTFHNAFVHTPICCPSRMSIMSGRYLQNLNDGNPVNNSYSGGCHGRVWQDDGEQETFAVYAKAAGYSTSYAGKYLSANPDTPDATPLMGTPGCPECLRVMPGYDKWFAQMENALYYNYSVIQSDNGVNATQTRHGDSFYNDYFPDLVANRTLAMIEEFTSDESERMPFLAVNAWPTPHGPGTPAPWAEDLHNGAHAPKTPNYNASDEYMQQKHWIVRQLSPLTEDMARSADTQMEKRLESLHSVDDHIGQIVDLLESKGVLENTYIIYTADNGFQLGQHRLGGDKRHLYEHDIRVPFIIAGPGVPKNVTSYRPVLNIDIAPSIYELITGETETPSNMDGASIIPYLQSLQAAIEADDAVNTTIEDPNHREDFLISYYGEGNPSCGLRVEECPGVSPTNFHVGESFNNTYHCVRSLTAREYHHGSMNWCNDGVCSGARVGVKDSIYCRFNDLENFTEYYDHVKDPWQLTNRANELSDAERSWFDARLAQLRSCKGTSCRELPAI